jgi:hypothetical protein
MFWACYGSQLQREMLRHDGNAVAAEIYAILLNLLSSILSVAPHCQLAVEACAQRFGVPRTPNAVACGWLVAAAVIEDDDATEVAAAVGGFLMGSTVQHAAGLLGAADLPGWMGVLCQLGTCNSNLAAFKKSWCVERYCSAGLPICDVSST